MSKKQINSKHKDSLFRIIFGEHKEYALALYNAINMTNYTDVDNLKIITLEDALYIDIKNDVGYIFHDVMNLIEHQSTRNPNMPLRGLGYFSDSYKEYISETYGKASAIYSERKLKIPTPKFYVLYNGSQDCDDVDLRLSDMYNGIGDVEVVAHLININIEHNKSLLDACKPLKEYSELIQEIRDNKNKGYSSEESVCLAIETCLSKGLLVDILKKERDKVENILIRGLTEEEKKELEIMNREYAIEQATEIATAEATEKATIKAKMESVDALVAENILDAKKACTVLGVNFNDYVLYIENKTN